MLKKVIDLQQTAINALVGKLETAEEKEITFKAPTGSGKTYMMADFMNCVLDKRDDTVFLVSSLSKGDLARQNYEKFMEYKDRGEFAELEPYLINSDIAGEEQLYIQPTHNVYVLPRDLYKKKSRLMQGAFVNFLLEITMNQKKEIILIRDECHIATSNLDDISGFFCKTINFSATPTKKQDPDVEITVEDAVNCNLIKSVKWYSNEIDTVADALEKFQKTKERYRNNLGVNPCLIIQISNKDKADEELQTNIMPALNETSLKWMLIVNDDKSCDTNDTVKKKLPVAKWKDYAKSNKGLIDVIIFKMVITEGWDIPRACMLYQVRDTQSPQLDEQVLGRVRRNPRLLDFENLSPDARTLATTAWVWVGGDKQEKSYGVELHKEKENITDNIKIKTTKLKELSEKAGFNIADFLKGQDRPRKSSSIFDLAKKLKRADEDVRKLIYSYATDYTKWWEAAVVIDKIMEKYNEYVCNYDESMEVDDTEVSFALTSYYTGSDHHFVNISDWVWKRRDNRKDNDDFHFDSEAELEWAKFLKSLSDEFKSVNVNETIKRKPDIQLPLFVSETPNEATEKHSVFLWGKNYVPNSAIKFEYYMGAVHSSFPDFVMKDKFDRIHIFEVKSMNQSGEYTFDPEIYKNKIEELKKCYKQASKLTGQIFYVPVLEGAHWHITQFHKGQSKNISLNEFKNFVKNKED